MPKRRRRNILKFGAFLLFVAAVTYAMLLTPTGALFRTAEGRSALVRSLDTLVQSAGPLGPVVFILIYTLGILFLPATPFTIAGAVIFLPREVLPPRGRPRVPRDKDAVARPEGGL
jgi:uncharacterized membrane protein YdjX (TVP38/TMEM64 family)